MALESKLLLMHPDLGDEATITAQSAIVANATNLQSMQPTDRWRTSAYTSSNKAYVEIDLGTGSFTYDFVALLHNNSTGSTLWRLMVDNDSNFGSLSYDSGTVDMWESNQAMEDASADFTDWDRKHSFYDFTASHITPATGSPGVQSNRYLRIEIYDNSHPDQYIEAGRLFIGLKWQPDINILYGSGIPWPQEAQDETRTHGGLRFPISRGRPMAVSSQLQFTTEAELYAFLFDLNRTRGVSKDLLYMHDPTSQYAVEKLIHGTQVSTAPVVVPNYSYYSTSLRIEALL